MKNKRYGVGFGTILKSKRTGGLTTAASELRRLITAGIDSRRLSILPVSRCPICRGKKEFIHREYIETCERCSGFGYIVEDATAGRNKLAIPDPGFELKVAFMSHPNTGPDDNRSYLVRGTGEQPETVRVYPKPSLQYVCSCRLAEDGSNCAHADAVRGIDKAKFHAKEGTE